MERGVPSPERVWSAPDYERAAQALSKIAETQPAELPRYQSERSGALFTRLTAFENVDFVETSDLDYPLQVQLLGTLLQPTAQILTLYLKAHMKDNSFGTETLELQSFAFHASARMLVALEHLDSSQAANPEAFKAGVAQIRGGMSKQVDGALISLSERELHPDEARLRFVGTLKSDLLVVRPWLPPLTQKEIPVRLESLIADESSPDVKRELIALRSALVVP